MTRSASGDASFDRLAGEGASLSDWQIADLAFGVASNAGDDKGDA
jgi:hypothetical protein